MKLLKWITGIFFIIGGLAIFTDTFIGGLLGLLIGVFILPPSHQLILEKLNINLSRIAKWTIVIGVFLIMCIFVNKSIANKENKAMDLVNNAEKLIEAGKYNKAMDVLKETKEMFVDEENAASKLESQFNDLNSDSFLKKSLGTLSDMEFELLNEGKLVKVYLENEKLNSEFIERLKLNSSKRVTFIKELEKEKQIKEENEERKILAASQKDRNKKIENSFSVWDGSHINVTKAIKKSMNDPDSYEHIETKYSDMKDHLIVLTSFRGTNAFGGKVINKIKAKVSIDGNILEINKE